MIIFFAYLLAVARYTVVGYYRFVARPGGQRAQVGASTRP